MPKMWKGGGAAPDLGTEPHRGVGLVAFISGSSKKGIWGTWEAPLKQHIHPFGSSFPSAHPSLWLILILLSLVVQAPSFYFSGCL